MGISEMIYLSYFFAAIAALSGVAAAAMFFAYDIWECWRILKGSRGAAPSFKPLRRQKRMHNENTEKLGTQPAAQEATVFLDTTETLGTMEMIQEITMMEGADV